jgi:hypothetical protein
LVSRQALAGMLWSKQYYAFDAERWLVEHGSDPLSPDPGLRNHEWQHMVAQDITTTGKSDRLFLERSFVKLMRNFGWWLNRKDADDRNIFQGGFLGLDNIGVSGADRRAVWTRRAGASGRRPGAVRPL